ncbi:hypothetical protein [Pedobacter panaciterrae]
MKLESLNAAKFQPLNTNQLGSIKGGEYSSYSENGKATVYGRDIEYANDCLTQWDDGSWHCIYVMADGSYIKWDG